MDRSSSPLFDRTYLVPVVVSFVIGFVAGLLIVNAWVGLAIGAVMAFSAIMRRYTAAKMEARLDEHQREQQRKR